MTSPSAGPVAGRVRRWVAILGAVCLVAGVLVLALRPPHDIGTVPVAGPAHGSPVAPGLAPATVTIRGVDVPVVPVSTALDGSLTLPDEPSTVGWWSPGALPGSGSGSVVLAGHVDSRLLGLGAFAVLRELGVGERITLRGDDGRDVAYDVVARREYRKAELPPDLFARDGAARLVLITCGGRFDSTTRSYDDNVVVFAEPL
ncbi:class F sortase [Pseudonocardia sulfidoxydans NBRC 16205]|uniref:Class F sortase n=1 Tax=Pseudonocardia sulfidoxydans NBRC 16205 TaxID=1223511 RepID=A0A511DAS1_9PSEU|nr:class F sortase [Pseudonocardia sulfidoxydans]GEL21677.1 class F sortase [Pseudonocardia sulfidoxydans NBRC 16205]